MQQFLAIFWDYSSKILRPNLPGNLDDENLEKVNIKTVITYGLVFLLFLCQTENVIIQWALENVLIEICHVFIIYYSGIGTSSVVQIKKLVLLSGVCTK